MSRIYLVVDKAEIVRRRALIPKDQVAEVWPDQRAVDAFWAGEESKLVLDAAGATLEALFSLPADAVPIYYGPGLSDIDSLPREESLRARVLSAGGIAVAWATLDRFGDRTSYEPKSSDDPVFHLRRIGGGRAHLWRLFRTRKEAIAYLGERYGADSEAVEWARALSVEDFDELLSRYAEPKPPL